MYSSQNDQPRIYSTFGGLVQTLKCTHNALYLTYGMNCYNEDG